MALKAVINALTDVAENLRTFYEPKDGRYVLAVEGDVPGYVSAAALAESNGKLVEFRDSNIKLLKALGAESVDAGLQRAGLISGLSGEKLAALKDLDPVAAKAAMDRVAELEKKGVKTGEDVQTAIKAALDAALAPLRAELAGEKQARTEAQARADKALLRQTIGDKYLKAGGRPEALDFIVDRAQAVFKVQDNAVKALENQFSADKPGQPLSPEEWLAKTAKDYAFAFEASKGGAAAPGSGAGASRAGARQLMNPTPEQLGELTVVPGKGLVDKSGQQVEIVNAAVA
jgi:hypothetical protein